MSRSVRVRFVTREAASTTTTVEIEAGQTALEAARAAHVEIGATCGGRGTCRSCRVKILDGEVAPATVQDTIQLGHDEVHERFRLSCQTKLISDCTILIAPAKTESGHQLLGAAAPPPSAGISLLDSGVEKHLMHVKPRERADGRDADIEQMMGVLPRRLSPKVPLAVLRKIPAIIRNPKGLVTITTFNGAVIDVEAGDSVQHKYGMAFDLGTTSIVGTLLDLDCGAQLAEVATLNPQTVYGGDLMSRIAFAQSNEKNLAILRAHALNAINALITEACNRAKVKRNHICKIVIVGNTCMHHILLGIDVTHVGVAPFNAVVRQSLVVSAKELPLKVAPSIPVCLLPNVGGFVGADAVSAVLATRMHESDKVRLLVDIGTNTEIVIGSRDRLMACSAPAGPAFEGGQIRHGMRAAIGAIDSVEIGEDITCRTIGDAPPIGICGSGLIDAVANMVQAELVDASGALCTAHRQDMPAALTHRIRKTEQGLELIIVQSEGPGKRQDITLTQADIRQFQLAKGAIHSAILVLGKLMGVKEEQISEVTLCGAFGNYLNIGSALGIGLLPGLPREKIVYAGNAAHRGAELALLSETLRKEADSVAQRILHVGIAEHPDFQDLFVSALTLGRQESRVQACC